MALTEATRTAPIQLEELRRAVLSEAGIQSVTLLFEQSVREGLVLDGSRITPELGGEATLYQGRLRFNQYPDPIHPTVRRIVDSRTDPSAMLESLQASAEGRDLLKTTGGLHALLYQLSSAPPGGVTAKQQSLLDDVVRNTVSIHFKTWTADPVTQMRGIRDSVWQGRYVGFWHIHPPRWSGSGFADGIEPSTADMENALALGQFMTIVFQPKGFDVYDLSPLAGGLRPDLSKARRIEYRSDGWSRRFRVFYAQ